MDAIQILKTGLQTADMITQTYLDDLTDEEMMLRPAAGCNHIKWQLGHLISSDSKMLHSILPDALPTLPDGFNETYSKDRCLADDPEGFHSKTELLYLFTQQRAAIRTILDSLTPEELNRSGPLPYAPDLGSVFSMLASHWLMHAGQWVVVRRQVGLAPKL